MASSADQGETAVSVDDLIGEWALASGKSDALRNNENLIRFLGEWLFAEYQPYPEKADFWDQLYLWLDQIEACPTRDVDQRAMFDFIPHLLFAGQRDLTAMYRAAYDGPIRRWLIDQGDLQLDDPDLQQQIGHLRTDTWFGSLAGMDISGFCRVNRIIGQSYRPEFRFIAEFCDIDALKEWLVAEGYKRIVVVEDMVGTGTQFCETLPALAGVGGKEPIPVLFVPLFIPIQGIELIRTMLQEKPYRHITCTPICVLPQAAMIQRQQTLGEHDSVARFRDVIHRHGGGSFGFGDEYGTLVLSHMNCPDNVPGIIHSPPQVAIFPRATRE